MKHKKNINSDIKNHMIEFDHIFEWNNVEILDLESNY